MAKKRVTVVIDANRWAAPMKKTTESALLTENGKRMCCLGFCARVAGFSANEIRGISMPWHLRDASKFYDAFPGLRGNEDADAQLANINDDFSRSKADRAKDITKLGKQFGIDFQFVNLGS